MSLLGGGGEAEKMKEKYNINDSKIYIFPTM
jgi:hypothetical protein